MKAEDAALAEALEAELVDYVGDDAGWARQAARQAVECVRLLGWMPPGSACPAEEEPEGCR